MADEVEKLIAEIEQRNVLRDKQNAIDDWLNEYERYFAETSNPICVWATIRYCDEKGIGLPDWVMAYLVRSASRVLKIAEGPAKQAAERCVGALGFSLTTGRSRPSRIGLGGSDASRSA